MFWQVRHRREQALGQTQSISIGYTRALVLGLDHPSAVPLVLSASQQAKLETDAIDRSS